MSKEIKTLVRRAEQAGWTVRRTRNGHLQFVPADRSVPMVVSGTTPSDHRSLANLHAQLRRSGLVL